ncbi:MAG: galactose mutarotase [Clostridia bacterium]|nr:galactose mutarotase [Clostridia bacterium]
MVTKEISGIVGGEKVNDFTVADGKLEVRISEYGAAVRSVVFDGTECVLGYDTVDGYVSGGSYQGATVGRYANRIGGGAFVLDGIKYELDTNENGKTTLHGGAPGFRFKILRGETVGDSSVRFSTVSPDGEGGFPGEVRFSVTFTVRGDALEIRYEAVSSKPTVMNFTNHSYFTLGAENCLDTLLRVDADAFTPTDDDLIPTGETVPVDGTAFDLREAKRLGDGITSDHPQIAAEDGYDHNFCLRGEPRAFKRGAAEAFCPATGIKLVCSTDMPGLQLYTANMLNEKNGRGGRPLSPHGAFCLETQFYPNSPNEPSFPPCAVKAGEKFESVTEFAFSRA